MWIEENNQLQRSFLFKDFKAAFAFMTKVAAIAEEMNHHPNWANEYNKVEIRLSTHDAGNNVTDKDHNLAVAIDNVFENSKNELL